MPAENQPDYTAKLAKRRQELPHIYRIVKDRKFLKKKGETSEFTHTVLDGGIVRFGPIVIPPDDSWMRIFYQEYVKSWNKQERLYFVEWPRPDLPHRLLFDFDMYFNAETTPTHPPTELQSMFSVIQETLLRRVFPGLSPDRCTLLVGSGGWSQTRKRLGQDQQERAVLKLGLHLIWRDIFVHTSWLPAIRDAVLGALQLNFNNGAIPTMTDAPIVLENAWDSVVDEHIARRPSARMFGSAKLDWCHCKQERVACKHYKEPKGGKGRVDVGRVYQLAAVLDSNGIEIPGLLNDYQTNKEELLFAASLCTTPPPDSVPMQFSVENLAAGANNADGQAAALAPVVVDDKKLVVDLAPSDDKCAAIKHYIRICYGVDLAKVQFHQKLKTYTCQSWAKRCFNNFDEEHSGSSSFFVVRSVYLRLVVLFFLLCVRLTLCTLLVVLLANLCFFLPCLLLLLLWPMTA